MIRLSLFSWLYKLKKQTDFKGEHNYMWWTLSPLWLQTVFWGPYFSLRTACLISDGKNTYRVCIITSLPPKLHSAALNLTCELGVYWWSYSPVSHWLHLKISHGILFFKATNLTHILVHVLTSFEKPVSEYPNDEWPQNSSHCLLCYLMFS